MRPGILNITLSVSCAVGMSGCTTSEQAKTSLIVVDGCAVILEGASNVQADEIMRSLEIADDCELISNTEKE